MRKYPTYVLSPVPITGKIAQRYSLAAETNTDEEYEIVCRALLRRFGTSIIETLYHLPPSLSTHYAVYLNPQSQYLVFFGSQEDLQVAQSALTEYQQRKLT